MNKFDLIKKIDLIQFVYLNYFCSNVIRKGKGKIIPYKKSVFSFDENSRIVLNSFSMEFNNEKLPGSKIETLIRLRKNAVWNVNGPCTLNYGCTIEILENGVIDSQYFTMNSNSIIVCAKHISIGNDVMIGRNVVIYDSDFHDILDEEGKIKNCPEDVIIGDHVWLCTNVTVLKGVTIEKDSVIGACSKVDSRTDVTHRQKWKR